MKLTDADVNELVQILESSQYGELHIETDKMKMSLRREGDGEWTQSAEILARPNVKSLSDQPGLATVATEPNAVSSSVGDDVDLKGLVPIRTPLLGTFYRCPRPGADPFVQVGDEVNTDTVIGIVETMKLMNSVYASVSGNIVEICRKDASFVEQESVLMLVSSEASE